MSRFVWTDFRAEELASFLRDNPDLLANPKDAVMAYKEHRKLLISLNISDNYDEYIAWNGMKTRCYNEKSTDYKYYGNRGIKVCDRWLNSFKDFLLDMGKKPSKLHSLDRVRPNGDYGPDNCRWATKLEQARNTRRNRYLTVNGETKCLQEWANILGVSRNAIDNRIKRGKTIEQAVTAERYRTNGMPIPHKVALTFTLQ